MKKILLPFIVIVLLAVAVLPASAGNGPGNGPGNPQATPQPVPQGQGTLTTYRQSSPRGTFAITGTITAIDATNKTITVTVLRGNNLAKPYINLSVTVVTTAKTRFLYKASTTSTATAITIADLAIDDVVSINGTMANNIWTASRVTEGASLNCLP
ncbi:MAG: hypothetical protein HY781_12170 [Chloroflexi bacterium]|nr:hypothetical protein [Chloroflexota bacterium]